MKQKILILILGILIGAVITAGCFLVLSKRTDNPKNDFVKSERRDVMPPQAEQRQKPEEMENKQRTENTI